MTAVSVSINGAALIAATGSGSSWNVNPAGLVLATKPRSWRVTPTAPSTARSATSIPVPRHRRSSRTPSEAPQLCLVGEIPEIGGECAADNGGEPVQGAVDTAYDTAMGLLP